MSQESWLFELKSWIKGSDPAIDLWRPERLPPLGEKINAAIEKLATQKPNSRPKRTSARSKVERDPSPASCSKRARL